MTGEEERLEKPPEAEEGMGTVGACGACLGAGVSIQPGRAPGFTGIPGEADTHLLEAMQVPALRQDERIPLVDRVVELNQSGQRLPGQDEAVGLGRLDVPGLRLLIEPQGGQAVGRIEIHDGGSH